MPKCTVQKMTAEVGLAERKYVLEHLKFGICPECGYEVTRRLRRAVLGDDVYYMEYCTNASCKFHKKAYREVYVWLVHHGNF